MSRGVVAVGTMLAAALLSTGIGLAQGPLPDDRGTAGTILRAEIRRSATPELLALLTDPGDDVRARAHLALGRIGLPIYLPRLIEATRDRHAAVRVAGASALGELDYELELEAELSARDRAAEALARALDDPVPEVAAAAAAALGRVGRRLDLLDAWLQRAGAGAPAEVLSAALHGRTAFPEGDAGSLAPFVDSPHPVVRRAAAAALGGSDDPARAPLLDRLLDDEDDEVRILALRALRFAPTRIAVRRTDRALRFGDWREQCAALEWLAAAWRREPDEAVDDEGFAAVLRRSLDRNTAVRICALRALASRPRRAVAIDRLLEALAEQEPAVRAAAAAQLAELPAPVRGAALERVSATGIAVGSDLEQASYVRLRARAGAIEPDALETLVASARPWTARAALEELELADPAAAWRAARAAVRGGAVPVVMVAAPMLGRLAAFQESESERAAAADELWARLRDDVDLPARRAALEAIMRVAPEIAARRASALPEMLPAPLRRRAFVLLVRDSSAAGRIRAEPGPWLQGEGDSPEIDDLVGRALDLGGSLPRLVLAGADRELSIELRADLAPVAVARLLERLQAGALELEVDPSSDLSMLAGRATGAAGAIDRLERVSGPLPTGSVVLPGAEAASVDLQLLLLEGSPQGVAPIGRVIDPVRTAGRWLPGDSIVLRLAEGVAAVPAAPPTVQLGGQR